MKQKYIFEEEKVGIIPIASPPTGRPGSYITRNVTTSNRKHEIPFLFLFLFSFFYVI